MSYSAVKELFSGSGYAGSSVVVGSDVAVVVSSLLVWRDSSPPAKPCAAAKRPVTAKIDFIFLLNLFEYKT